MRNQFLGLERATVGIPDPSPDAPAWGILMETGSKGATVTLVALADGIGSLYTSTGGGVIGGA
jgi:hypothetical protein